MVCHFLFQGIFLTQGLNLHFLHQQTDSLPLSHLGRPRDKIADGKGLGIAVCLASLEVTFLNPQ